MRAGSNSGLPELFFFLKLRHVEADRWKRQWGWKKTEPQDVLSNVDHQMREMMSDSLNLSFGLKSQHSCHYSLGQRCPVKITGRCDTKEE